MQIEYEATFLNVNKDDIREKLKKADAKLIRQEFLQKRVVFNPPKGHEVEGAWLRIRDEGDKVTMSYKIVHNRKNRKIEDQKEICLIIDNFKSTELLLSAIGCERKAYQESKRELWTINGVDITIDEWPHLEPFVEVEGDSEKIVKMVSEKIGFDYNKAMFCSIDTLYNKKYGVSEYSINNETPEITFKGRNPFIK